MTSSSSTLSAPTERELERLLDDQLVEPDAPGASPAVVDADGVVCATGLGARTLDPSRPRRRTRCCTSPP